MPISGIITEGVFVCNPISNTEEGVVLCLSIPRKVVVSVVVGS